MLTIDSIVETKFKNIYKTIKTRLRILLREEGVALERPQSWAKLFALSLKCTNMDSNLIECSRTKAINLMEAFFFINILEYLRTYITHSCIFGTNQKLQLTQIATP